MKNSYASKCLLHFNKHFNKIQKLKLKLKILPYPGGTDTLPGVGGFCNNGFDFAASL